MHTLTQAGQHRTHRSDSHKPGGNWGSGGGIFSWHDKAIGNFQKFEIKLKSKRTFPKLTIYVCACKKNVGEMTEKCWKCIMNL